MKREAFKKIGLDWKEFNRNEKSLRQTHTENNYLPTF